MSFDVVAKSKVFSGINFLLSELLLCLINALYHRNWISWVKMIWSKVSFSILRFTFNFQNKLDLVRVNYFKKYTYHHQFIMEQSQTSSPEPKTPKIEHENSQEIVQNIIQDVVHEIVPSHQLGNLLKQRNLWILWFINIFLWTFVAFLCQTEKYRA